MGAGVKLGPSLGPAGLCAWCSSVFGEGQSPRPRLRAHVQEGPGPLLAPRPLSPAPLAQALNKNLTVAQHTQLILTLMHGLCSLNRLHSDLAAELLQMILEDQGTRQEQVGAKVWRAQPLSRGPGREGAGWWRQDATRCRGDRWAQAAVGPKDAPGHQQPTALPSAAGSGVPLTGGRAGPWRCPRSLLTLLSAGSPQRPRALLRSVLFSRAEGNRPPPGFNCLWPGSANLVPWGH